VLDAPLLSRKGAPARFARGVSDANGERIAALVGRSGDTGGADAVWALPATARNTGRKRRSERPKTILGPLSLTTANSGFYLIDKYQYGVRSQSPALRFVGVLACLVGIVGYVAFGWRFDSSGIQS
jgi:hypothetical protein